MKKWPRYVYSEEEAVGIKAAFGEAFFLTWSPTRACFLDCDFCVSVSPPKIITEAEVPSDIWERFLRWGGTKDVFVRITGGGEPLFMESMRSAFAHIPSDFKWCLQTNGVFLDKVKWPSNTHPSSGVTVGFYYDELVKKGLLEKWKQNVLITAEKIPTAIGIVAAPPNLGSSFDQVYEEASQLGLRILLNPLEDCSNPPETHQRIRTEVDPARRLSRELLFQRKLDFNGKPIMAGNTIYTIWGGEISQCTGIDPVIGHLYPTFAPPVPNSGALCTRPNQCGSSLQGYFCAALKLIDAGELKI